MIHRARGFVILLLASSILVACGETLPEDAAADRPYQACLERANRLGGLSYAATTVYQPTAIDRFWPRTLGRASWRSPVEQCSELRARGQLTTD